MQETMLAGKSIVVHLATAGSYPHPWYGSVDLDAETFEDFKRNFKSETHPIDVCLDVRHEPDEGAAGWFSELTTKHEETDDGRELRLYGHVALTEWGYQLVKDKRFRYCSIEYGAARARKDGTNSGQIFYGAALTNRPFLTCLNGVDLSVEPAWAGSDTDWRAANVDFQEKQMAQDRLHFQLEQRILSGGLPPHMRELMLRVGEYDAQLMNDLLDVMPAMPMGRRGRGQAPPPTETFETAVTEHMKTHGVNYREAFRSVGKARPDLYKTRLQHGNN